MRKLLLGLSVLGLGASIQAKELTFHFDVYSSGPMIYACNAGLRHSDLDYGGQNFCHLVGTDTPCTPATVGGPGWDASTDAGDNNCVCTSYVGEYKKDFMRAKFEKWDFVAGAWDGVTQSIARSSGQFIYGDDNMVVPASLGSEEAFATWLKKLNFNLGSERYGAKYFVDICYRGSQIDYYTDDDSMWAPDSGGFWVATMGVGITDHTGSALSYVGLAQPHVRGKLVCDLQGGGNGTYVYAHNGTSTFDAGGDYDTFLNDITYTGDIGTLTADYAEFFAGDAGSFVAWTANGGWADVGYLTFGWVPEAPRFCIVRYEFMESSILERKWQRHDARFVLKTEIYEPSSEDTDSI